jgi:hypothetical protein
VSVIIAARLALVFGAALKVFDIAPRYRLLRVES